MIRVTTVTKFKVQRLEISAGLGTHIDSPAHCIFGGKVVAEIAGEFIYDTIIFDFTEFCESNFAISLDLIKDKMSDIRVTLNNKFIILKTGWSKKWGTKEYFNDYLCPHITEEVGWYFAENGIAGLGIDTFSPDLITKNMYCPVYEIFLSRDIFIIENIAHLEKINVLQCRCIIAPLKITSTESPIRLVALIE